MKKNIIILSLITTPFFIVGCGGGSSTTTISNAQAKVSGTVPGTFIEAYCDDGTYVSTKSVQNGTSKHPFELSLPKNITCRFVMTTNENNATQRVVSPININGKPAVKLTGDTDIGYVDIPATYAEATDTDGDHVQDSSVDVTAASINGVAVNDDATKNPFDRNNDGKLDLLEDRDGNHMADGWDDKNNNGKPDLEDDSDGNHIPDLLDDKDKDGIPQYDDDNDNRNGGETDDLENHNDNSR
jgi:hypothetical protein